MSTEIQLLHLSDLHFGPHSRFQTGGDVREADRLGKAFHRALVEANLEGRTDLVFVTGDIAETARRDEFATGEAFLAALAGELGIGHERFVFVPGNHDVSWFDCKRVAIDQEEDGFDDDELRCRLNDVKLRNYEGFLKNFYSVENLDEIALPLGHDAYLYNFTDLRLTVAALNSCEVESHREEDHRGYVSRQQAQSVMNAWRVGEVTEWLKIVAVHHNPVRTVLANVEGWREHLRKAGGLKPEQIAGYESDVVGLEGREHLEAIVRDCRVQLVLHGHHHARDEQSMNWASDGRAHVLSAGSLTLNDDKLPRDEPASVRVIRLLPEEERIEARSIVYVGWARTESELVKGAFVEDLAEKDGYRHRLDLPSGFNTKEPLSDSEERVGVDPSFLRVYRDRLKHLFSRWDLANVGVVQPGGAGQPLEATLDEMYVPLRFAKKFNIKETNLGSTIKPAELLQRDRPLIIRGPGGSGKTTWMRWTFRRLLEESQSLPLILVLRDLAHRWSDESCAGASRSLDIFLDNWVAEYIGSGWEGEIRSALASISGPRPILLVDGWDELGELGEELRLKLLGFMEQHKRLLVIVSSRPYGTGRPSSSEGFEVLDIQPLSDHDVRHFSYHFFNRCHGGPSPEVRHEAENFEATLNNSPAIKALTQTALLLTMMLLISRSRPLPDKRHQLYESCIENLLTALPNRRERQGVKLQREQWRPVDSEERMRVVARLAYKLQRTSSQESTAEVGLIIIRNWEQVENLLPQKWKPRERSGFLRWLVGPAGLLIDRSDETLSFRHLSFQEYLSARHLDARDEGNRRVETFLRLLGQETWWETLLLWAAIIERGSRERLAEVLGKIINAGEEGLSLVGLMLADGLGSSEIFSRWIDLFFSFIRDEWSPHFDRCARAWAASRQDPRKRLLLERIRNEAIEANWFTLLRLIEFSNLAFGQDDLTFPVSLAHELAVSTGRSSDVTGRAVAAGRIFCGCHPLWPINPLTVGLLHLWGGRRRLIGISLQAALICGAGRSDVQRLIGALPVGRARRPARSRAKNDVRRWIDERVRNWVRGWGDTTAYIKLYQRARYRLLRLEHRFAQGLAIDLATYLEGYKGLSLSKIDRYDLEHDLVRGLSLSWEEGEAVREILEWARSLALDREGFRDYATSRSRLSSEEDSWAQASALVELYSVGRAAARAQMAYSASPQDSAEAQVLAASSRLSFQPNQDSAEFEETLKRHNSSLDPLWPALARHLARRSTDEDRALLKDLARHPEKREPPLQWGLQFIVRGDVMDDDGNVFKLDDLCDELGLPRLPYLEEMPDEIELPDEE